jgi:hypothetical protein
MVSSPWSLVPGLQSLVSGHWSLVLGPSSLDLGLWSLLLGPWSLVLGPWSLVLGPWSLVLGPWSLLLGPWSLVLGPLVFQWFAMVEPVTFKRSIFITKNTNIHRPAPLDTQAWKRSPCLQCAFSSDSI